MSNLEQVCADVLAAKTVSDLEDPMNTLIILARNYSPLLSKYWKIISVARGPVATLRKLSDLGEDEDNPQNPIVKLINWFGTLADIFNGSYMQTAAVGILIDLWNELGQYQDDLNKRTQMQRHIYRAGVGFYIGRIYLQGDPGAAIWWLLHAHADDLLSKNKEGAAKDMLRLTFGVDKRAFDYMESCAEKDLIDCQRHTLFAEHVVM